MDQIKARIHRLSLNQLRALSVLVKSTHAMAGSTSTGKKIGLKGKSLGGVYSSLSRQKIKGESLVEAWGRDTSGCGLRWRLNEKLVDRKNLRVMIEEILKYE